MSADLPPQSVEELFLFSSQLVRSVGAVSPIWRKLSGVYSADMSQANDFSLDMLMDTLAQKVADKISQESGSLSPRLMTVEQAALYLGRTKEAVNHMVALSKLPTVRTDRRVFIDRADLDEWIEENKVGWADTSRRRTGA